MHFLKLLLMPVLAAALLLTAGRVYPTTVVALTQQERSAPPKKPAQFHYVCPMHETVTSKTPGKCPKCKMKLVKKRIKEPVAVLRRLRVEQDVSAPAEPDVHSHANASFFGASIGAQCLRAPTLRS